MEDACENIYKEYDFWKFRFCILKREYRDSLWYMFQLWYQKPWGTFRQLY